MKKYLLFVSMFIFTISTIKADDLSFGGNGGPVRKGNNADFLGLFLDDGNLVFCAGYGTPNLMSAVFTTFKKYGDYTGSSFGPLHIKFEYFLSDEFGIGISSNIASSQSTWVFVFDSNSYKESLNYNSTSFNVRFNYHFYSEGRLDIFAGGGLGYRFSNSKFTSEDPKRKLSFSLPNYFPVGFEATCGIRYFFNDNIGIYAEVGIAKSIIQAGIAINIDTKNIKL